MKPLIPWFEPPVLNIPIGDFTLPLHGFGVLVAIGFVVGGNQAMQRATRLGMDPEVINRLIGWLVFGTFLGGHVGYGLMYKPQEYFANPVEFLKVWQGLSSFGGFAVCVPIAVWFFWKEKVPSIWAFCDCLAYGLTVGWFFGRMGCFVAHDHPGTPTEFWLGVYGMCPGLGRDVACHDMGLYEALWSIGMYGVFRLLDRRALVPGVMTLALGACYGPVRFAMDFLRPVVTDVRYAGFTPGQYWSIALTLLCVGFAVQRARSGQAPIGPAAFPQTTREPAR